jgi:hypothetical protein
MMERNRAQQGATLPNCCASSHSGEAANGGPQQRNTPPLGGVAVLRPRAEAQTWDEGQLEKGGLISSKDRWGPFATGIDRVELVAQLRSLRAIVRLSTGSRGSHLEALLKQAETDTAVLAAASTALGRLDPLDRRRVWSSYAGLNAPHRR